MNQSVTIEIPAVPGKDASPNAHAHWRKRAAAVKALRAAAKLATVSALNTPGTGATHWCGSFAPVVIDVDIEWPGNRKRMDDDNAKACCKGLIDGVSDAFWQGSDEHVELGSVRQRWGRGVTVITVREGGS